MRTHVRSYYETGRQIRLYSHHLIMPFLTLCFQMNYVKGVTEFSDVEIESAKSSLTFEVIEEETTVADVSHQSLLSYLAEVPHTYNK